MAASLGEGKYEFKLIADLENLIMATSLGEGKYEFKSIADLENDVPGQGVLLINIHYISSNPRPNQVMGPVTRRWQ